jgi:SAM-dependent methyltransferase
MGIDIHTLNFLRNAKKKKPFGETVTIGRQGLHASEHRVKELVGTKSTYKNQVYCEELLTEYFGATNVESIDNSDYEKATRIHNMNEPLPQNLCGKFDTVIDGGCLEHIFNVPQAFKNCSLLCKQGGQILHILPANNFCGHGFWQFSPELFFALYSTENGYEETEVFLADLFDRDKWYQVQKPTNGKRVNIKSSDALYVLVRTVLKKTNFAHINVQQSDYVYEWNRTTPMPEPTPSKGHVGFILFLIKIPFVYKLLSPIYHLYLRANSGDKLDGKNPELSVITVKTYI